MKIIYLIHLLSLFNIQVFSQNHEQITYEINQDSVWIETSNGKIFGLLYSPIGIKIDKTPAVLCLQGGGDVGLTNYIYEAKFFAKNGIVALVCDKSGAGSSKTKKSWREQSFKDKTNEYFELFEWLSNHTGIDKNKVGVHGMSEGGRLALVMAVENPKVAFVNSVSGPIVSYKETQIYAIKNHLMNLNTDTHIIKKSMEVWEMYFDDIAKGKISKKTLLKVNELIELAPMLRYRPDNSGELPQRPLTEDINFTIKKEVKNINCPVFFQYGKLDKIVDPVISLTLIPEKSNFEIKNYDDTDHSMNFKNGDVNPLFIEDKLRWIKRILD